MWLSGFEANHLPLARNIPGYIPAVDNYGIFILKKEPGILHFSDLFLRADYQMLSLLRQLG